MDPQTADWLLFGEWLIAIGILGLVAVAFAAQYQTHKALRRESAPNLLFEDVAVEPLRDGSKRATLRAKAVNLGTHPVYIVDLTIDTDVLQVPHRDPLRQLIPASDTMVLVTEVPELASVEDGDLWVTFYYGASGTTLHRQQVHLFSDSAGVLSDQREGERS